ncbi:HU family DNA-binding protein [Cellulomonas sp. SLBN-39]|uniref:HU family DNA-binding protein n=1 Tax=Cellulomonas sp. SLBN-39 TaxID=2768446 RepID=UPI0011532EB8|nr:HU family DNA-binding protein [Cellulomonas sp. SLBN-39]TQL03726.1 DNA-binding protein HU-beta [Cellulomonas sp. SLBN-39]
MVGRADLVDRVVARTDGAAREPVARALDALLAEVTAALAAGERVTLTGFGTFEPVPRPARRARHPRTGAVIDVAASTAARFRPGAGLRSALAPGAAPGTGTVSTRHEVEVPVAAPAQADAVTTGAAPPTAKAKPAKAKPAKAKPAKAEGAKGKVAKGKGAKGKAAKGEGAKGKAAKGRATKVEPTKGKPATGASSGSAGRVKKSRATR